MKAKEYLLAFLTVVILAAGTGLFTLERYLSRKGELFQDYAQKAESFERTFRNTLDMCFKRLGLAMEILLHDASVVDAFAAQDRERLLEKTLPLYKEVLHPKYAIEQFQFHLPPAVSFLRLHKLDRYGDDLSAFRHTVVTTNAEKKPTSGIEVGLAGPGVRVVYPVYRAGNYAGSVELGESLAVVLGLVNRIVNLEYAVAIKDQVFAATGYAPNPGQDVAQADYLYYAFSGPALREVLRAAQGQAATVAGASTLGTLLGHAQDAPYVPLSVAGRDYLVQAFPLHDFSRREIGKISVFEDVTEALIKIKYEALLNGGIAFGVLGLLTILVFSRFHRIRARLETLLYKRNREIEEKTAACDAMRAKFQDFAQLKRGFVATVVNGMNGPLLAYQGYLREFLDKYHRLPNSAAADAPELREGLKAALLKVENILQETQHLSQILEDYGSLEALREELVSWNDTLCHPHELLEQVERDNKPVFQSKPDVAWRVYYGEKMPMLWIDPKQLRKALNNLVQYALRRTARGFVELSMHADDNAWAEVVLSYSGDPLDEADIENLFDEAQHFLQRLKTMQRHEDSCTALCVAKAVASHYGGTFSIAVNKNNLPMLFLTLPPAQARGERF